jgi:excisionase family DNA binding protein
MQMFNDMVFRDATTGLVLSSRSAFLAAMLCESSVPVQSPDPSSASTVAPPSRSSLLVTAREAAKMLSVCEKTLWSLTARGEIPVVRIGRSVRYSLADLNHWIEKTKSIGVESLVAV